MAKGLDNKQGREAREKVERFLNQILIDPLSAPDRISTRMVSDRTGVHYNTLKNHGLLGRIEEVEAKRADAWAAAGKGVENKTRAMRRADKVERELEVLQEKYDNLLEEHLRLINGLSVRSEIDVEDLLNHPLPAGDRGVRPG